MNKRIALLITVILSLALFCGCSKEEVPVVTEQPVLGEDVVGYVGFAHLQAYTMTGGDGTVVYLPASEAAYVGGTCVISETQGVEVTINQDPMLSDSVANKSVKQKLTYALDSSYNDTLTKNMLELEKSGVTELDNGGAFAEVSYLIYDDANKRHISYWIGNYYVKLEDGREFQVEIRVNSGAKTEETQNVVSELEKYLGISLPYDEAAMQAKIDGYSLSDDEAARMNGETVAMGGMKFYMPEGWVENQYSGLVEKIMQDGEQLQQSAIYTESADDENPTKMIAIISDDMGEAVGAQYGVITEEWQKQEVENQLEQAFNQLYHSFTDVKMLGMEDYGYVFKMTVENIAGYKCYMYLLYKGNMAFIIEGAISNDLPQDEKKEFFKMIDRIYSSMDT